eukprot:g21930.t1
MAYIATAVRKGQDVSSAMEELPGVFPDLMLEMVSVAEQTGSLPEILKGLAEHYENLVRLRKDFVSTLIFPIFQFVAAVLVIALLIYILGIIGDSPGRQKIDVLGFGLLGTKGALIWLSMVSGTVLSLFVAYQVTVHNLRGKKFLDRFLLNVPVVGNCLRSFAIARFSWAFYLTEQTGMPIDQSLKSSLRATDNGAFIDATPGICEMIQEGSTLCRALEASKLFPKEFLSMVEVAETSGTVPEALHRLSPQIEEDARRSLARLTTALAWTIWATVAIFIIFLIFRIALFYVFSLARLTKLTADGVTFRSHIDGSPLELTPESATRIQEQLGADMIMCLDECPPHDVPPERMQEAVDRTTAWAARCRDAHARDDQALFGILQGGTDRSLRERSAKGLLPLDFPGYAIGGLSVGESPQAMYATLDFTVPMLPADRPRYLMGVGTPVDLIEAVTRGVDLFDCVMPTRNGRNATAFTDQGVVRLRNLVHQRDPRPLDPLCGCPACTQFSRAYLRHLFISKEMLGPILISLHNIAYYQRLLRELREAIRIRRVATDRDNGIETARMALCESLTLLLAEGEGGGGFQSLLVPMIAIGIIFWFIVVRGGRRDREKRQAQLNSLKKNDRVVTIGGIIGTIATTSQDGKEVTLKIDDNTRMKAAEPSLMSPWIMGVLVVLMVLVPFALLKAGGEIEYHNKDKKAKARTVSFPKETENDDLKVLEEATFDRVAKVDLAGTKITDEGLKYLEKLKSVDDLDLNNTAITDAGLEHLKGLSSLSKLDLGDTAVTDAGLKHLHGLKDLKVLNLAGQSKPKEPRPRGWDTALRLGIDLRGGTNLVYQVVGTEEKPITSDLMNQMIGAVKRRLDPAGTEEITVRKVGSDRIEVIIPKADPAVVAEKKRLMTRLGTLEFALLANRQDHGEEIALANSQPLARDIRRDGRIVAGWREVGVKPDGSPKDVTADYGDVVVRQSRTNKDIYEFLVIFGAANRRVTGEHLNNARPSQDENGRPAVSFTFNLAGANRFAKLTGENLPSSEGGFKRRLAILLDDRVHSAPSIISTISSNGQITGSFTQEEVQELTNVLNAGALVLEFRRNEETNLPTPISEQTISPTLGADVQEKGKFAIIVAASAVVVFMLLYYLFAGVVADICLVINLILVMGAMAFIDAAFTLPGLAGIVLTIGMAVDANVLIFERIREEQNRGSSLRMSIQNGFSRAFTTIIDANLTTLITAVVLYMIGTDQVRGFAVTLFIGIVMSMFSALFVGRLIFDIWERKRWLKTLKMNSVVGSTSWDFVSKKSIAAVVSVVIIVAGIAGVVTRGSDLLDIDFSGGTMVTFEFEKEQNVSDIKAILEKNEILADGMSIEVLKQADEDESGEANRLFRLRGKEQSENKFKQAIIDTLKKAGAEKYALRQVEIVSLSKDKIVPIDGPKKKDGAAAKKEPTAPTEYSGGHRVTLEFTDAGVKLSTFRDYVVRHLRDIKPAGDDANTDVPKDSKYSKPQDLFKVRGVAESEENSELDDSPRYQSIELTAKKNIDPDDLYLALANLKNELAASPIFPEVNKFDSSVAGDMRQSAILALVFSLLAIVGYIWFRFKQATFGLAAVAALVHDVLVVLGIVALAPYLGLEDFKLNLPMIAAFLTIVGYSLNDTIVVFDRVREVRGKNPAMTNEIVNTSLNQTLSRTILTSLTTFIVVGILFFAGGEGIHGFAFCLVLGVVVGTYSSIYVASPVLLWLMNRPSSAAGKATAAEMSRAQAGTAG